MQKRSMRSIVGNLQAAEDVAQDTFTQIWNRPNGFEPERGTLRAYVFGIGRERAAEWWRKQTPYDAVAKDVACACQTETSSIVGDAFRRIPEDQRTLLWLREVEGSPTGSPGTRRGQGWIVRAPDFKRDAAGAKYASIESADVD